MKVLFVDDELQVLKGLQRTLEHIEEEEGWEMEFVSSGQEALDAMDEEHFDVLVSDMRMPGMDGSDLLERVSKTHVDTVRIVLSGQADKRSVYRAVGPMHQYLSKPCDANVLKSAIDRSCSLRDILRSDSVKQLIGSVKQLPSIPELYQRIVAEVECPDSSLATIGDVISQDMAMTAKILQIANSAAFGVSRQISSAGQAASLLGVETIKGLVLSVGVFNEFKQTEISGFSINSLLTHCLAVGTLANRISKDQKVSGDDLAEALTAGVLHDIGKLVIFSASPEKFVEIQKLKSAEQVTDSVAERKVFGTDHAAIGAYLLSLWGLPQSLVEAVAFHHSPNSTKASEFNTITALTAANVIHNEGSFGVDQAAEADLMEHLEQIGLTDELPHWRELGKEATSDE